MKKENNNDFRGFATKSQFMSFIRSGLRRMWSRQYPPRRVFASQNLSLVPLGRKGRLIKGGLCEHCKETFKASELEVDHIKQNHKLTEIEHISEYCNSLFCEISNMRYLCKPCHKIITYSERHGISIEEAKAEKQAISFSKLPVEKQKKLLKTWGVMEDSITNAKKRRATAKNYYTKTNK